MAYLTVVAAYGEISRDQFLLVLGVMSLVSAAFPLYFTRGKHLSWIVFLLVGVLVFVARGTP
jgi:hypothetical protein